MADSTTIGVQDESTRETVARLARPRPGGGHVIERAAIMAAGSDGAAIEAWILAHAGRAEQATESVASGGLHSHRQQAPRGGPLRFVLPPGALDGGD